MISSFVQFPFCSFLFRTVIESKSSSSVILNAPACIDKIHVDPGCWSAAADFASCWSYIDRLFGADSAHLVLVLSSNSIDLLEYWRYLILKPSYYSVI